MARYIDADLLDDEYYELYHHGTVAVKSVLDVFKKLLDKQPTADVVEVVRCKDCKKFIKKGEEFLIDDVFGICEKSRTGFFDDGEEVYGNDFCSYGERRTK